MLANWSPYFIHIFLILPNAFPESHSGHHVTFTCPIFLGLSWLQKFLIFFLFWMTLTVLRSSAHVFCRMGLKDLSDVFPLIRLGLWVWGRKSTEIQYHIISRVDVINIVYHCWCWPWSPDWDNVCHIFHCKVTYPSPFPWYPLWKEVTLWSPHLKEGNLCSLHPLTGEHLHNFLDIFCKGNLSLLHQLFICSVIYISRDSWIFMLYFGL